LKHLNLLRYSAHLLNKEVLGRKAIELFSRQGRARCAVRRGDSGCVALVERRAVRSHLVTLACHLRPLAKKLADGEFGWGGTRSKR